MSFQNTKITHEFSVCFGTIYEQTQHTVRHGKHKLSFIVGQLTSLDHLQSCFVVKLMLSMNESQLMLDFVNEVSPLSLTQISLTFHRSFSLPLHPEEEKLYAIKSNEKC